MHLSVTKEDNTAPTWKGLVELNEKRYAIQVDVRGWSKGGYQAEVILQGAIFQHPIRRNFVID